MILAREVREQVTEVQAHIFISLTEGNLNKILGTLILTMELGFSFHQNRLNESKDEYSSQVVPQQKYKSTYLYIYPFCAYNTQHKMFYSKTDIQ